MQIGCKYSTFPSNMDQQSLQIIQQNMFCKPIFVFLCVLDHFVASGGLYFRNAKDFTCIRLADSKIMCTFAGEINSEHHETEKKCPPHGAVEHIIVEKNMGRWLFADGCRQPIGTGDHARGVALDARQSVALFEQEPASGACRFCGHERAVRGEEPPAG